MSEVTKNKISKLFGPKIDNYYDLTKNEKRSVTNCYNTSFPTNFCSRCRFYGVCKDNQHLC